MRPYRKLTPTELFAKNPFGFSLIAWRARISSHRFEHVAPADVGFSGFANIEFNRGDLRSAFSAFVEVAPISVQRAILESLH